MLHLERRLDHKSVHAMKIAQVILPRAATPIERGLSFRPDGCILSGRIAFNL